MGLAVNASIVDSYVTGLGNYTIHLTKELSRLEDDVLVYTSQPLMFPTQNLRLRSIATSFGPAHGKGAHIRRLLWTQWLLPIRLWRDAAKALFCPIPEGPFVSPVPTVLVMHDLIPLRFSKDYPSQRLYFQWYVKPLVRRARKVIAVSEATKADLVKFFRIDPARIHVIPCGCDHEVFYAGINPEKVKRKYRLRSYCLYVGNLHPHKNLGRLIQAFHRVAEDGRRQLVIVGKKDPRFYPALQSLADQLGLGETVVFLDYVPPGDLPGLYAGAEVFVHPSLHEGFGLPLVEAMACGVPVIASRAGATETVVGKAGLIVDPTKPEEIADAIRTIFANKECRETLVSAGLDRAQYYSWRSTAQMVARVIHECAR